MIIWLAAILLAAAVVALIKCLGLLTHTRAALAVAEESLVTLGDRLLDDEARETILRRHAFRLFKLFGLLALGGAVALFLPLAALRLADRLGAVPETEVLRVSLSWPFLTGSLVAGAFLLTLGRNRRPSPASSGGFENRYSTADRWLHHLAFAGGPWLLALSRLEDRCHRRRLARVRTRPPVFITSLPRAGTTLLLNLCSRHDEFAVHTYRRMPFVLTPLGWEKFSRPFRRADTPRERAHGDGLLVSADSPEALEEILWLNFWPEHYQRTHTLPWSPQETRPEFVDFFTQHGRKLIAATNPGPDPDARPRRYLSKNNANIARLAWLARAFPEAKFVIPFRAPLQHAASLLRQHRRFLDIHQHDAFARHYMAGLGHFDFGANLRPIDFAGWTRDHAGAPATELAYWLRYWLAAYGSLVSQAGDRVRFVDFDALCAAPAAGLASLAHFLDLADRQRLVADSHQIHAPKPHRVDTSLAPPAVLSEAHALHARLIELARPNQPTPPSPEKASVG